MVDTTNGGPVIGTIKEKALALAKRLFSKEVLVKAGKTFWQTAVPAIVVPAGGVYALAAWKGALITAGAAGLSAVWNGVIWPAIGPTVQPWIDQWKATRAAKKA